MLWQRASVAGKAAVRATSRTVPTASRLRCSAGWWIRTSGTSSNRAGYARLAAGVGAAALGAGVTIVWHSGSVRCDGDSSRPGLLESERSTINLFNKTCPSVASVITLGDPQLRHYRRHSGQERRGAGSGFVWDKEGHVVTNFHVVQGAGRGAKLGVQLTGRRRPYQARVVGTDPQNDIAVLRIEANPDDLTPLPLGSSHDLQVGQNAIAIGNPFGLDYTLTTGVISGIGREITGVAGNQIPNVIQTDAAMNPGNSGGPLIDSAGRVIGVNTMILSPSGASAGIGFAIPIDMVRHSVEQLMQHGKVSRPSLGISVDSSGSVLKYLGIRGRTGLLVMGVTEGSGAEEAGIRPTIRDASGGVSLGDIIVSVENKKVRTIEDLFRALTRKKPGQTVTLQLLRSFGDGGEEGRELARSLRKVEVDVRLARR